MRRTRPIPSWRLALLLLTLGSTFGATVKAAESSGVVAYRARYQVSYRGIGGGNIAVSLQPGPDGNWVYETQAYPNMLGRLAISSAAHERGVMEITADGIRPLRYDYDAGRSDDAKDIHIEFDWQNGRVHGSNEGREFAYDLSPGTHDTASVQAAMLCELAMGRAPQSFRILTGGKIRDYRYWSEGNAHLKAPLGEYDTVIWANQREGSSRVSKAWHAPSLGYVPVQAIQYRDGRAELEMRLIKLEQ
jgi:hypothetical protein